MFVKSSLKEHCSLQKQVGKWEQVTFISSIYMYIKLSLGVVVGGCLAPDTSPTTTSNFDKKIF